MVACGRYYLQRAAACSGRSRGAVQRHGLCEFTLVFGADGRLHCGGTDDVGRYGIIGRHRADHVVFTKRYAACTGKPEPPS